jgi:hypothetical protein
MSVSPTSSTNVKTYIRMTQAARYRVTGRLSDARIAELVGLTPGGFAQMAARPEYREIEESLLDGRISKIDEQIAGDDDALRQVAKTAVPMALRAMVEIVQQRRDLRSAMAAAKEILDRDPEGGFRSTRAAAAAPTSEGGPTLPSDIIASLSLQGNKVIAEIRTQPTQVAPPREAACEVAAASSVLVPPAKPAASEADASVASGEARSAN